MANKLYEESNIQAIANAIRAKGQTGTMTVAQMPSKIAGIKTKSTYTWNQCPTAVKNYLDNVTYNPNDYTTSQIANYAPATAVQSNTKPIGKMVDGVTHYNEVPNVATPFSSTSEAGTLKPLDRLRWINTPQAVNVRDIGGWSCDGGTVKYGLLFRGGQLTVSDRNVLVKECGVRVDLDLRSTDTHDSGQPQNGGITSSPLGADVKYFVASDYNWYHLWSSHEHNTNAWRYNIRAVFSSVIYGSPVYFHCSAGADRTGTLVCVIEGLLGMSQSDIDKDYELTCFYSGTGTDSNARRRNESEWSGLIAEIEALSGATFRDKCVNFVASLGFTAAEINAFRAAMIDGTPTTVTPSINTFTVTNTLSHVTSDNASATATQYQPYEASIEPESGYDFESVALTMGGTNIKASCYVEETYPTAKGRIKIPNVIGNIVLTASAIMPVPKYTNRIPLAEYPIGTTVGIMTPARWSSSGALKTDYAYMSATGYIPVSNGDVIRISGLQFNSGNAHGANSLLWAYKSNVATVGSIVATAVSSNNTTYINGKLTNAKYDSSGNLIEFTVSDSNIKYIAICVDTQYLNENSVITVNELIV